MVRRDSRREWIPAAKRQTAMHGESGVSRSENIPATIGGKFRLLECVEQGSDFAVYRAERVVDFAQTVTVRLPYPDPARPSAAVLESLRAEQRALASLQHAGIAGMVDASLEATSPWIATEFAEGEPLNLFCDRHKLGIRDRLALFLKVLDALAFAHRRLVVHGALTFERMRVDEAGNPRLAAFTVGANQAAAPLSTAADVQAAGRLLYELLVGKAVPEPAAKPSLYCAKRLRHWLRGDLDAIVLCALAPQPAARYADASAFAADLRNVLNSRPVEARHGGALYRALRLARRNRLAAAAVGVLAAIAVCSATVIVEQNIEAARARAQAQVRLADTQRLTDSMLVQLSAELDRLPGAEPVETAVLHRIAQTLDRMAQQAGSESAFRENLAREYLLLARLLAQHPQPDLPAHAAAARGLAVLGPLLNQQSSSRARQLAADLRNVH